MARFAAFLATHPCQPSSPPVAEQLEILRELQITLSLRPADRLIIYLGAVFGADFVTMNRVEANKEVWTYSTHTNQFSMTVSHSYMHTCKPV